MKVNSKSRGFVEGTLVLMADGSQKPIEQIKSGDIVLSFDEFDASAPLEPMSVTNTFSRIDNNILEVKTNEGILKVAKDQMFIGPHNDWKEVYNHSLVVDVDGNPVKYTVNKVNKGKHRVYDITVDENHSLIANGIRVHNALGSSATSADGSTGGNSSKGYGASSGAQARTGNDPSGLGSTSKSTGSVKSSNTKGTSTTKESKTQNSNAGKTSTQSANNSLGSRNNSGADREGGGNRDVGINKTNANNKKVTVGKNTKKVSKKSKDEPTPTKPSGVSVSTKLVETIADTVDVLQELVNALDPVQLTATKITIQSGVDSIYSFANSFNATLYTSEMSVYDKTELLQMTTTIMNTAAELRNPFEETFVTAAGKKIAIILLSVLEAEVNRCKDKLGMYVTKDTKGGLVVSVNGIQTNQETEQIQITRGTRVYTKKYYPKVKKAANGRYTSATTKYGYRVRTN